MEQTALTLLTVTTGWSGFRQMLLMLRTSLEAAGRRGGPFLEVAARPDGAER